MSGNVLDTVCFGWPTLGVLNRVYRVLIGVYGVINGGI